MPRFTVALRALRYLTAHVVVDAETSEQALDIGLRDTSAVAWQQSDISDIEGDVQPYAEPQRYMSPTGKPIVGTLEALKGIALISGIGADGQPVYAGETKVLWDEQKPLSLNGHIFVDEDDGEWIFSELTAVSEEDASHAE